MEETQNNLSPEQVENVLLKEDTSNLDQKFEVAYKLNEYVQDLIVFSDQKANFITTINLGLLAGNFAILASSFYALKKILSDLTFSSGLFIGIYAIYVISIVIFQWISFSKSIGVVQPNTHNTSKKPSIFFFKEIAVQNHEDFKKKFFNKSGSEFLDDLIYQAFDKSVICQSKFNLVDSSIMFLKINLALTVLHPFINLYINLK